MLHFHNTGHCRSQNWSSAMEAVNEMLFTSIVKAQTLDGLNAIDGVSCLRLRVPFIYFLKSQIWG